MPRHKRGGQALRDRRSTGAPRWSSSNAFTPMKRSKSGASTNSTTKSQSLSGRASPRAREPKRSSSRTPSRANSDCRGWSKMLISMGTGGIALVMRDSCLPSTQLRSSAARLASFYVRRSERLISSPSVGPPQLASPALVTCHLSPSVLRRLLPVTSNIPPVTFSPPSSRRRFAPEILPEG